MAIAVLLYGPYQARAEESLPSNLGKFYGSIRFGLSVETTPRFDGTELTYAEAILERGRLGFSLGTALDVQQAPVGHVPGETDAQRSLKDADMRRKVRDRVVGGGNGWHPDLGVIKIGAYLKERNGKIMFESGMHCRKQSKPNDGYECKYQVDIQSILW